MKEEIEINERIEDYLNGILPPEESAAFRKQIEEDPALAKQVEEHRLSRAVVEEGAYLKMKQSLQEIHLGKISRVKKIRRITGYGTGILVTGLLVFLSVLYHPYGPKPVGIQTHDTITKAVGVIHADSTSVHTSPSLSLQIQPAAESIRSASAKAGNKSDTLSPDKQFSSVTQPLPVLRPEQGQLMDTLPEHHRRQADRGTPAIQTAQTPQSLKSSDCSKVSFKLEFIVQPSCNNKATGSLKVLTGTVTGGTPPYSFSMSRTGFKDSLIITRLYAGNYPVYVRDIQNCIGIGGVARIESVDCSYQAVFDPSRGELWTVPVESGKAGTLQIFSKTGNRVYDLDFSGYGTPEWNGSMLNGQQLPMGIYQFEIIYPDGHRFEGTVTIVR